jgi:hypothetical protein
MKTRKRRVRERVLENKYRRIAALLREGWVRLFARKQAPKRAGKRKS